MAPELFAHNQTAYESVVQMLADTGKTAIIHPSESGKPLSHFSHVRNIRFKQPAEHLPRNTYLKPSWKIWNRQPVAIPRQTSAFYLWPNDEFSPNELEQI